MRRLLLTLAASVLAFPAFAQEPIPWANKFFSGANTAPPPVILHDFGTLPKGTVKTYRFNMMNIYAVPMQIPEPKSSCGCLSITSWSALMHPRETGHVDIKIDTGRIDGYKSIKIPVRFEGRDPKTQERFWSDARLEVRFVSRPDIAINPGALDFATVAAGQKTEKKATIFYSGRQRNWQITEYGGFKKEVLDVKVAPVPARGGVAYEVIATLKPNAPAAPIHEQIVLKTNDKESPALILTVTGKVQAPLMLVGAEAGNVVKMGGVEVGKKVQKRVVVQAGKEFKVTSIAGQGDGMTAPLLPVEASTKQVITVIFAPEKIGPVKKELTVNTSSGESIVLIVEGIGTDPK